MPRVRALSTLPSKVLAPTSIDNQLMSGGRWRPQARFGGKPAGEKNRHKIGTSILLKSYWIHGGDGRLLPQRCISCDILSLLK